MEPIFYITNSGIKICLINMEHLNTINITIHLPIGASSENNDEIGIAHFLEHMLFIKIKKYDEDYIDDIIDYYGGNINAETSYDKTIYYIYGMAKYTKVFFDILYEIYFNSIITEEKFNREKNIIIKEINENYNNDDIAKTFMFNNRYYKSVGGNIQDINKITLEKLLKFKKKHYKLDNTTIIFFGKLNITDILNDIKEKFGNLNIYTPKYFSLNDKLIKFKNCNNPIVKILELNKQVTINLYFKTINIYNKWYYKFNILINILKIYLYKKLRHYKGLIYQMDYDFVINRNTGYINISFDCSKNNIIQCLKIIFNLLYNKLKNKFIKYKYINKNINIYHTKLLYLSEKPKYKLSYILKSLTYNIKNLSINEIINIIKDTNENDIKKMSKALFNYSNTFILIN